MAEDNISVTFFKLKNLQYADLAIEHSTKFYEYAVPVLTVVAHRDRISMYFKKLSRSTPPLNAYDHEAADEFWQLAKQFTDNGANTRIHEQSEITLIPPQSTDACVQAYLASIETTMNTAAETNRKPYFVQVSSLVHKDGQPYAQCELLAYLPQLAQKVSLLQPNSIRFQAD
jgi:hypothetical protein